VQQGISSKAFGRVENREKTFQGQRFDDELELNWVQFKWRNHDPQIGRFIEIDPLANDYVYNSTFAFSENKVTNHVELEGLEAQALPATAGAGGLAAGLVAGLARLTPWGIGAYAVYTYAQFAAANPCVAHAAGLGSTPLSAQAAQARYLKSVQPVTPSVQPIVLPGTGSQNQAASVQANGTAQSAGASTSTPNPVNNKGGNQGSGDGRSANKLQPDKSAQGDHSTFARDKDGNVYKYQEWKKNDRNPNGFDPGKRFDGGTENGKAGAPHFDKKTGVSIATPHVNESKGVLRLPENKELPQNYRFFSGLY
jgi:RHS repeat-associated protein